ncbi:Glutamyl-tRNA(Gln) amidotransferase subunit A-like protein [Olavius sp. associated proteobacterium Delta 1]|nr:Glutamyl-tRNA(Gln) amidotransferase subunit A-like protein [Olavius sp. associated proteobacterium Delta 1]
MSDSKITSADIAAGEKLVGIEYTPAERELMVGDLDGQIAAAGAQREVIFPNSLPPATTFDPRLPGKVTPTEQTPFIRSGSDPGPLPQTEEDIAFAPVTALSEWLRTGQISSRRLTEIYLGRLKTIGPKLECVMTLTEDLALQQADAADEKLRAGHYLGPLHGIPYGLKDLFDTRGIGTTWGAAPFKNRVAERDARIVELLRDAGAVLLAKTTLGALAYGDIWFGGTTRNPWNLNEGASGSSAGSAAATAAGLVGFSIGTETLGSITSPSQRCGTTGLRPTFGRTSRIGAMALCWSLDKIGSICRSVEDTALVLQAINGHDPADLGSLDVPFNFDASRPIKDLRVGYIPAAFESEDATDIDRAALEAVGRLGVELVEISLPELPYMSLMNILFAEAAAAFEELTLSNRDDELACQDVGAWPNVFRKARFLSAVDHVQLDRLRYQTMQVMDDVFKDVDIMIGPFAIDTMMVITNFTGHPCLLLRAGFVQSKSRGAASLGDGKLTTGDEIPEDENIYEVPQGISLWGRLFDEGLICSLGMALEAELDVCSRRPPIA